MSDLIKVKIGGRSFLCKWNPSNEYDYSMEEIKIGTWIDGSDVYRRVISSSYNVLPTAWGKVIADSSIKQVISCTAITSANSSMIDYRYSPQVRVNDGYVELWTSESYLNVGDKIILEYTKNEA